MSENSIMKLEDFNITEMSPQAASAIEMHSKIISSMQTAAAAMVTLCENLKRMRDTQSYKAIGFERFEDYTEKACGIKKRQAYNYIQTFERLGSTVLQSNAQLGITKLQLLTEVTAVDRADFIESNDLENISVSEMKELVAKTKQEYKDKLAVLTAQKAEAEEKARSMAARLDKNADADLVKASTYFTEAQESFNKFIGAVLKINASEPEKAEKLKAVARQFLTEYIKNNLK